MTPPVIPEVYDEAGRALPLGRPLGRGGEAAVFLHARRPEEAVKLYHRTDTAKAEKLRQMIANPPDDPARAHGHVSFAWPEALVHDADGQVCGFVMPAADLGRTLPLHQLCNPKTRRERAPGLTWRYLVRSARNLAAVMAALHEKGYVLGDLNESNALISDRALVTLVDCDSAQVRVGARVLPCPVGKPEFTAPELQGASFKEVTRTVQHDRFALAALVFMLLMEGVHPFGGVPREGGRPGLELPEAIRSGRSPYLPGSRVATAPTAPPLDLLSPELRRLLRRALRRSRARPDASAWQRALEGLERTLQTCSQNPQHVYGKHLRHCPWCQRQAKLGVDAFPPLARALTPPRPAPERAFVGGLGNFLRRFWLSFLTLLAANAPLAWGMLEWARAFRTDPTWHPALLTSLAALAAFSPSLALALLGYRRARRSTPLYRGLRQAETLLRAALGGTLATGLVLWALRGDWLIALCLWVLAFGLLHRVFRCA